MNKTTRTAEQLLADARAYANEDEESPRRGAIFFLTEDLFCQGALTQKTADGIWDHAHTLSDEACVEICRKHGASI